MLDTKTKTNNTNNTKSLITETNSKTHYHEDINGKKHKASYDIIRTEEIKRFSNTSDYNKIIDYIETSTKNDNDKFNIDDILTDNIMSKNSKLSGSNNGLIINNPDTGSLNSNDFMRASQFYNKNLEESDIVSNSSIDSINTNDINYKINEISISCINKKDFIQLEDLNSIVKNNNNININSIKNQSNSNNNTYYTNNATITNSNLYSNNNASGKINNKTQRTNSNFSASNSIENLNSVSSIKQEGLVVGCNKLSVNSNPNKGLNCIQEIANENKNSNSNSNSYSKNNNSNIKDNNYSNANNLDNVSNTLNSANQINLLSNNLNPNIPNIMNQQAQYQTPYILNNNNNSNMNINTINSNGNAAYYNNNCYNNMNQLFYPSYNNLNNNTLPINNQNINNYNIPINNMMNAPQQINYSYPNYPINNNPYYPQQYQQFPNQQISHYTNNISTLNPYNNNSLNQYQFLNNNINMNNTPYYMQLNPNQLLVQNNSNYLLNNNINNQLQQSNINNNTMNNNYFNNNSNSNIRRESINMSQGNIQINNTANNDHNSQSFSFQQNNLNLSNNNNINNITTLTDSSNNKTNNNIAKPINNSASNISRLSNLSNQDKPSSKSYKNNNSTLNPPLLSILKNQAECKQLQNRIENSPKILDIYFSEIYNNFDTIVNSSYTNYLLQKIMPLFSSHYLNKILNLVIERFSDMCMNHLGTRIVQKVISTINGDRLKALSSNLEKCLDSLVKDYNGIHVVSKYVANSNYVDFVYDYVIKNIVSIATDKDGCCLIQKILQVEKNAEKRVS